MINLLVPDMPTADDLLPYLRRIDAARIYVNNGNLVKELQSRLEAMTGAHVAIVSNGTVALELALKAACPNMEWPFSVIAPALTFSATGLAAQNSRFNVHLVDVDKDTWQMIHYPKALTTKEECAFMPVATFGTPVPVEQWEGCHLPVVIDAAGAFAFQEVSRDTNIATCFSLHATKFVGCGEGGFVASANKALIERVREMAAFGEGGTNAKMSEYHAAVALASLDAIPDKMMRTAWRTRWYEKHGVIDAGLDLHGESAGTIMNVLLPIHAAEVIPQMLAAGIETKQWYRPYLDERAEFAVPRGRFPVTDHLREHLLGIPFHNFMIEADVAHVCSTLKNILRAN